MQLSYVYRILFALLLATVLAAVGCTDSPPPDSAAKDSTASTTDSVASTNGAPQGGSPSSDRYFTLVMYRADAEGNLSNVESFEEMTEELIEEKIRSLDWVREHSGDNIVLQGAGGRLGIYRPQDDEFARHREYAGEITATWTYSRPEGGGHSLFASPLTVDLAVQVAQAFYRNDDTLKDLVEWKSEESPPAEADSLETP